MCKWIEQAFHSRVNINCYGNQEEYAQLIDKKKCILVLQKDIICQWLDWQNLKTVVIYIYMREYNNNKVLLRM